MIMDKEITINLNDKTHYTGIYCPYCGAPLAIDREMKNNNGYTVLLCKCDNCKTNPAGLYIDVMKDDKTVTFIAELPILRKELVC